MGEADSGFEVTRVEIPVMPGVTLIGLRGRVDYRTAPELRKELLQRITGGKEERLVIELGGVDAMDTAGAAVLVEAMQTGRVCDKAVLFCAPSAAVVRTFRLAGLVDALARCCSGPDEVREKFEDAAEPA